MMPPMLRIKRGGGRPNARRDFKLQGKNELAIFIVKKARTFSPVNGVAYMVDMPAINHSQARVCKHKLGYQQRKNHHII